MIYDSNKILCSRNRRAFTIMEVLTALMIVSVITFGVLVVINQGVAAMIEGRARMQAFELARENMEKLISSDSVTDTAEFGVHELNEDVQWETVVESFDEPVNSDMWIRAICSASYPGRNGERETIELVHWLTNVSSRQKAQIEDQQKREQEFLENMEGNPFGDDPDGLMQYSRALYSMGDYQGAADALLQILLEYPESSLAGMAVGKIVQYAWGAVQAGDSDTAQKIFDILRDKFPNDPYVQALPDLGEFEPGILPPVAVIPARFRPTKPATDKPSDSPGEDTQPNKPTKPENPDQPTDDNKPASGPDYYKGVKVPPGFYDWPQNDQNAWKGLVDLFTNR